MTRSRMTAAHKNPYHNKALRLSRLMNVGQKIIVYNTVTGKREYFTVVQRPIEAYHLPAYRGQVTELSYNNQQKSWFVLLLNQSTHAREPEYHNLIHLGVIPQPDGSWSSIYYTIDINDKALLPYTPPTPHNVCGGYGVMRR